MKTFIPKTIFLVILSFGLFVFYQSASADTHTVASCSLADVSSAVSAASAGDIVNIPAGSAIWSSQLSVTKPLTIMGAGSGTSGTVITAGNGTYVININPSSPGTQYDSVFRISNIRFLGGAESSGILAQNSTNSASYYMRKVIIDHNYLAGFRPTSGAGWGRAVIIGNTVFGVAYSNTFVNNYKSIDAEAYGDDTVAWQIPADIGGPNSFYIEDNTFSNTDAYPPAYATSGLTSGGQGGRYVWRHNLVTAMYDPQVLDVHGEYSGTDPGSVSAEIYDNTINMCQRTPNDGVECGVNQFLDLRGGTAMVFNNKLYSKFTIASGNVRWQMRADNCQANNTCAPGNTAPPCLHQVTNTFVWNNYVANDNNNQLVNSIASGNQGGSGCIVLNRDYWRPAIGTESAKPGTCTINAYYGSTDTDKLWKCTATNVWTLQYQPYTYPHPLRNESSGDTTPPAAPQGLSVT